MHLPSGSCQRVVALGSLDGSLIAQNVGWLLGWLLEQRGLLRLIVYM